MVILDKVDFNMILGMTWLSPYISVQNCNTKTLTLEISGRDSLEWRGVYKPKPVKIISFIWARRLVGEGLFFLFGSSLSYQFGVLFS